MADSRKIEDVWNIAICNWVLTYITLLRTLLFVTTDTVKSWEPQDSDCNSFTQIIRCQTSGWVLIVIRRLTSVTGGQTGTGCKGQYDA